MCLTFAFVVVSASISIFISVACFGLLFQRLRIILAAVVAGHRLFLLWSTVSLSVILDNGLTFCCS